MGRRVNSPDGWLTAFFLDVQMWVWKSHRPKHRAVIYPLSLSESLAIVIFHSYLGTSTALVDPTSHSALPACIHASLPSRVLLICVIYDENFDLEMAKSFFHTYPSPPQGVSSGYVEGIKAQLLPSGK